MKGLQPSRESWQLPVSDPPQRHDGDFVSLIKSRGLVPSTPVVPLGSVNNQLAVTHGTTTIVFNKGMASSGEH